MVVQKPKKIEKGPRQGKPEVRVPERSVEKVPEKATEQQKVVEVEKELDVSAPTPTTEEEATPATPSEKDDLTLQIEKVLEEDLGEIYFNMSPEKQKEFTKKGEETATGIRKLMGSLKIKTKEVVKLISDWLKVVPGINKFFIEQETKIKADKILEIKNPK